MLKKVKRALCGAIALFVCFLVAGQCQMTFPAIIERQEIAINITGFTIVALIQSENGNFLSQVNIPPSSSAISWNIRRPGVNSTYQSTSISFPQTLTGVIATYDKKELSCFVIATLLEIIISKIDPTTLIITNLTIPLSTFFPNVAIPQIATIIQNASIQTNKDCQLIKFKELIAKINFTFPIPQLVSSVPLMPIFSDNLRHVISNINGSAKMLYSYDPATNTYILAASIKQATTYVLKSSPVLVFVLGITNTTMSNMSVIDYDLTILNINQSYLKVYQNSVKGSLQTIFNITATPNLTQITFVYRDINLKTRILDLKTKPPSLTKMIMTVGQQTYLNLVSSVFTNGILLQSKQNNVILSMTNDRLTAYSYFNSQNGRLQFRNDINPFNISGFIFIDQTSQPFLQIIIFSLNNTIFTVKSYNFGNFNSTIRALNPSIFNLTSDASSMVTSNIFQWSFATSLVFSNTQSLIIDRANCSNVSSINPMNPIDTICQLKSMVALHQMINIITPNLFLLASNTKCKLMGLSSNNSISSFYFNQVTNQYQLFAVGLTFNQTINLTQQWAVSQNCDRIFYQQIPFYYFNGTYMRTNSQNFSLMAVDANILWGATNNNIFKYESNVNSFVIVHPGFSNIANKIFIRTSGTKILLISDINSTNTPKILLIQAFSYNLQTKTLVSVLFHQYLYDNLTVSQVNFITSTNIDFLFIIPKIGGKYAAFRIYYALRKGFQIMLPQQFNSYPSDANFSLSDGFLTLRFNNLVMNNSFYIENIIYEYDPFKKSYFFKNAQAFSMFDPAIFKRFVPQTNSSYLQLYSQSRLSQTVIQIKQTLVQRKNSFERMNERIVINNSTYRCPVDCLTCFSTTMCSLCTVNSYLASDKTCAKCEDLCFTCSQSDRTICINCAVGSFLNISVCVKCNPVCLSCATSANNCIACPTKHYLAEGNNCVPCKDANCAMCSLLGVNCTMCIEGFTPLTSGTCVACFNGCSKCAASDIFICLGCSPGFFLTSNKTCNDCSSKCLTCLNANRCLTCDRGYHLASSLASLICAKDCDYPCLTCNATNSTLCLTCFGSGMLVNATCVQNTSCNTSMNCLGCQGLNYLANGQCLKCTTVTINCLKCNPLNSSQCIMCLTGFFVSNGTCLICNQGCKECYGSLMCKFCNDKYVLHSSLLGDQCLPCVFPCLTCFVTPTQCLSCLEGYVQIGVICIANASIGFVIVFKGNNSDPLFVLQEVSSVVGADQREIILKNITQGSINSSGIVKAINKTVAQNISKNILQSLNDPNRNVISAQFDNVQSFVPKQEQQKGLPTLAIILLSILIPFGVRKQFIILVSIILALYCCLKNTQQQQIVFQSNKNMPRTRHEMAPISDVKLMRNP